MSYNNNKNNNTSFSFINWVQQCKKSILKDKKGKKKIDCYHVKQRKTTEIPHLRGCKHKMLFPQK